MKEKSRIRETLKFLTFAFSTPTSTKKIPRITIFGGTPYCYLVFVIFTELAPCPIQSTLRNVCMKEEKIPLPNHFISKVFFWRQVSLGMVALVPPNC